MNNRDSKQDIIKLKKSLTGDLKELKHYETKYPNAFHAAYQLLSQNNLQNKKITLPNHEDQFELIKINKEVNVKFNKKTSSSNQAKFNALLGGIYAEIEQEDEISAPKSKSKNINMLSLRNINTQIETELN